MHQSTLQFVSHVGLTLDAISHGISGGERWSVGDVQSKLAAAFKEPDEWGPGTVIDICRGSPAEGYDSNSGCRRTPHSSVTKVEMLCTQGTFAIFRLCTMGCAVPLAMGCVAHRA